MRRPHLIAVVLALALGTGVSLGAQQSSDAWLLLTNGERVDGVVTWSQGRGGFGQVFGRGGFTVDEGRGRVSRVPVDQVALVDFTATRPTTVELASLPASGHVLVLTNGSIRPGQLLELTNSAVRWQPVRGTATTVPLREVRRIYLDLDRSYELAQGSGPWGQPAFGWARGRGGVPAGQPGGKAGPTDNNQGVPGSKSGGGAVAGGKSGSTAGAQEITVLADQAWTDTGITVRVGQTLRFEAEGRILFSLGNENVAGPDGAGESGSRFPVPSMGIGGLIGKVGPTGRPFAIGMRREPIRMPANGRLMLGVNDDHYDDNAGAFRVWIQR